VRYARALVFDFDDTLVYSNEIKWRAFQLCFADFPDRLDEIRAYCRRHNHTLRRDKFRYIYQEILRLDYTSDVAKALEDRFASETTRPIIQAPEIPGATPFLAQSASSHITALLSSTPHEILVYILSERGWRDYFKEIQGAPVDKASWLLIFQQRYGIEGREVVVFGDTKEDAEATEKAGCAFIAVGDERIRGGANHGIRDFAGLLSL
jgi:phosphoglycolate phosphatase-like HAD superfamily hydrolase